VLFGIETLSQRRHVIVNAGPDAVSAQLLLLFVILTGVRKAWIDKSVTVPARMQLSFRGKIKMRYGNMNTGHLLVRLNHARQVSGKR